MSAKRRIIQCYFTQRKGNSDQVQPLRASIRVFMQVIQNYSYTLRRMIYTNCYTSCRILHHGKESKKEAAIKRQHHRAE